jgi:creatinine amidohydrolase/Fe(II)-dependent formamide hydrolase-like protein
VLPAIPYVYPGASGPWPGTIDVGPEISIQYIKEVAKAALRAGLRRLVISGMHGPVDWLGTSVIRSIYQETGQTVALLNAYQQVMDTLKEDFGWTGEDLFVLGALRVLGLEQFMQPDTNLDIDTSPAVPSIPPLQKCGVKVPYLYTKGSQHTGIRSRLKREDAERAAACLRKAVDRMADVPELFSRYQREMAEVAKNPPWKKPDIWSM